MSSFEKASFADQLLRLPRYATDGQTAIKPGFERIQALLAAMGGPEKTVDVALVAGTNGKGSTASFMAACLTSAGYRTGLHTSPHLFHLRERMRVNGKPPDDAWLEQAIERFFPVFTLVGASFFEATLALSLLFFAESDVTHAVVEVGLGGRLDATNVLSASVSVITGVALDHTEILGPTVEAIAREKAGIIKPGKPIVLGLMPAGADSVIRAIAHDRESPLRTASAWMQAKIQQNKTWDLLSDTVQFSSISLGLSGSHQLGNAITALCALDSWTGLPNEVAVRDGLARVAELSGLRGRTEILTRDPVLMVDVAHNPDGIAAALAAFNQLRPPNKEARVVLGLLSDKDVVEIGQLLAAGSYSVCSVPTQGARGLSSNDLTEKLIQEGVKVTEPCPDVSQALIEARRSGLDCIALGSHSVAAEALTWHQNQH